MKRNDLPGLLEPIFTKKDLGGISYRTLNYWDSSGFLLSNDRKSESEWRKFSVVEFIWIQLLEELRTLNVSIEPTVPLIFKAVGINEKAEGTRKFLNKISPVITGKKHLRLVISSNEAHFISYEEHLNHYPYHETYLSISINKLVNRFVKVKLYGGLKAIPFQDELIKEFAGFQFEIDQVNRRGRT